MAQYRDFFTDEDLEATKQHIVDCGWASMRKECLAVLTNALFPLRFRMMVVDNVLPPIPDKEVVWRRMRIRQHVKGGSYGSGLSIDLNPTEKMDK